MFNEIDLHTTWNKELSGAPEFVGPSSVMQLATYAKLSLVGGMVKADLLQQVKVGRAVPDLEAADLDSELILETLLERLHLRAVVVSLARELQQVRLSACELLWAELVKGLRDLERERRPALRLRQLLGAPFRRAMSMNATIQ